MSARGILRKGFLAGLGAENAMTLGSLQAAMASGFTVTSNPDPAQLQSLGLTSWPIWGCEISAFPWTYDEQEI